MHAAFIPKPTAGLLGLGRVNADLVGFVQRHVRHKQATLDMDATLSRPTRSRRGTATRSTRPTSPSPWPTDRLGAERLSPSTHRYRPLHERDPAGLRGHAAPSSSLGPPGKPLMAPLKQRPPPELDLWLPPGVPPKPLNPLNAPSPFLRGGFGRPNGALTRHYQQIRLQIVTSACFLLHGPPLPPKPQRQLRQHPHRRINSVATLHLPRHPFATLVFQVRHGCRVEYPPLLVDGRHRLGPASPRRHGRQRLTPDTKAATFERHAEEIPGEHAHSPMKPVS